MLHTTVLSDMARIHQADLLREAQTQALLKRAGVTPSAQSRRLLVIAAFVVTLALALAGRMG